MRRHALVAGAAGRLGEALLSEVVGSPRYREVTVLTRGPLGSTVGALKGLSLAQLRESADPVGSVAGSVSVLAAGGARPFFDSAALELDVFVCWSDADDPLGRAHNQRDAIYEAVATAAELRVVATAAAALHARRLLLLAPLLAWQQISAAARMLPEAMEMELARLPIPAIVIMRPTTERQAGWSAGGSRMQRFARFYLSQLRFMLPAATQSLRSIDIARAALSVMAATEAPGLTVVSLDEIRQHAGRAGVPRNTAGAGSR